MLFEDRILNGKLLSEKLKDELAKKCNYLYEKYSIKPKLGIVLVGDNPASKTYVNSKIRSGNQTNISCELIHLSQDSLQEEVENAVKQLAIDKSVNGIIVQLPLPKGLNEQKILSLIPAEKDVDGLTLTNAGSCFSGIEGIVPCTPKGVMEILNYYKIPLEGKHAVVIGRSNLVGKPLAIQLLNKNCTVTLCHSRTKNLSSFTTQADILVVAVGKKHLVNADMIKENAIVIDVGINREDGILYGDVDFNSVILKARFVTPVPGGVGPMTVTMLLTNTYEACLKQNGLKNEF